MNISKLFAATMVAGAPDEAGRRLNTSPAAQSIAAAPASGERSALGNRPAPPSGARAA